MLPAGSSSIAALVVLLALALGCEATLSSPLTLYVNCSSDENASYPYFQTVAAAQAYIRTNALVRNSSVKVLIDGLCRPDATGNLLSFSSEHDSDLQGKHTVTFAAWVVRNRSILSGELLLPPNRWNNVAHSSLIQATLTSDEVALLGPAGFGEIANGGLGQCSGSKLELFTLQQPMILARYPNPQSLEQYNGPWMQWMHVSPLTNQFPQSNSFLFQEPKCASWAGEYQNKSVWLHGFWSYDWADNFVRVLRINVSSHGPNLCRVEYDAATPPVYGVQATARFYILNLPSEVDMRGEYYIDDASGTITLFPPRGNTSLPNMYLNVASGGPLVTQSAPIRGVHIEQLEVRFVRGAAVALANAVDVTLSGLHIHSVGSTCVSLSGANSTMTGLNLSRCRCSGAAVSGGDLKTLEPANIIV